VAYFLSIAAMVLCVLFSLVFVHAGNAGTPDSCPDTWRGVACNGHYYCNLTGRDSNIPGCDCDQNNICQDAN
jgi:hypothetical protein